MKVNFISEIIPSPFLYHFLHPMTPKSSISSGPQWPFTDPSPIPLMLKTPNTSLSSVQSLSHVRLFAIPWTTAHQASLSITNSQSLLKLMSIESVMPSNHLILCHLLLFPPSIFPRIRIFSNESVICIRWPNIGVSASASVLPKNIQEWFLKECLVWCPCSPRDS